MGHLGDSPDFFTSPNFPNEYGLTGDVFKYLIGFENAVPCCIFLTFDDWNLAPESVLKVCIVLTHEFAL